MAGNDNPQAVRFLKSMEKHGKQEAGEQFAAEHPLGRSAGAGKKFQWAKDLCAFLNENYDDETVRAIRTDCVCGTQYGKDKLRKIWQEVKEPRAFVEKTNELDLGYSLEYDGSAYYLLYPQCYCSCVNKTDEQLPAAWCYCTLGYTRKLFGYVFDKEVRAELISAVKTGGSECRIRITAAE